MRTLLSIAFIMTCTLAPIGNANADPLQIPPNFPNLAEYVDTNPNYAYRNMVGHPSADDPLQFNTPGGLGCKLGSVIECAGGSNSMPGIPSDTYRPDGSNEFYSYTVHTAPPAGFFRFEQQHNSAIEPGPYHVLPAGQKLTHPIYDSTCAVTEQGVACISGIDSDGQRHGFILQPSGSWVF